MKHWRRLERRKVALTLRTGTAFIGVLYSTNREFFELVEASIVTDEREISADGVVLVERSNVDYLQVLA